MQNVFVENADTTEDIYIEEATAIQYTIVVEDVDESSVVAELPVDGPSSIVVDYTPGVEYNIIIESAIDISELGLPTPASNGQILAGDTDDTLYWVDQYTHPSLSPVSINAITGQVIDTLTSNSTGHITRATLRYLVAGDIPTLPISKITGLQTALDNRYTEAELQGDGTAQVHWNNLTNVPASITGVHNDLTGLQGGTTNEYYHLTNTEYGNLIYKVGTPVNNQLAVWTGDGTIEGTSNIQYDGTTFSTYAKIDMFGTSGALHFVLDTVGLLFQLGDIETEDFGNYLEIDSETGDFQYHDGTALRDIYHAGNYEEIPNFDATHDGLTPLSGGGTTNFLRADGTWAVPSGGTPGGSDTYVQYNDANTFAGESHFAYYHSNALYKGWNFSFASTLNYANNAYNSGIFAGNAHTISVGMDNVIIGGEGNTLYTRSLSAQGQSGTFAGDTNDLFYAIRSVVIGGDLCEISTTNNGSYKMQSAGIYNSYYSTIKTASTSSHSNQLTIMGSYLCNIGNASNVNGLDRNIIIGSFDSNIATGVSDNFDSVLLLGVSGVTADQSDTAYMENACIQSDRAYYLGMPTVDGSWRFILSGDDLLIQQRESSSWNTKSTISGA